MSISNDHTRSEFDKGNYLAVALKGGDTDWRTHASRGLIDLERSHAKRLSEFDGEEANFYCAVLHWMDSDEKTAISILEQSNLPVAQRFLKILAAPKLKVICQLSETMPSPFALFRSLSCDERFELTNIDFRPRPGKSTPSANLMDHLDLSDPPVFFISSMVESNPLPDKLENLNCPIFGHVTDNDMALQTLIPMLTQFDELIVNGALEQQSIGRLTGKKTTVYPHHYALEDKDLPQLSELRSDEIDIDVLMTGTWVDHFHPDKRDFLRRILKCRDIDPLVIHGFLPKKHYYHSYQRAHIIASLHRFNYETLGQGTDSRLLEALAVGRPIFSVRGSVFDQLATNYNGIYHFEKDSETIGRDLTRAINKERLKPLDRQTTAKQFRRLYGLQNIGPRYLRFLTFRTAMNEGVKRTVAHNPPINQRVTGWTGFPKVAVDLRKKTMSALSEKCRNPDDWESRLTAAREFILSAAEIGRERSDLDAVTQMLNRGANLLREIILIRPHALAARFNLIRALLHLGAKLDRIEAINLLNGTLRIPSDRWQLNQLDHVMPFDFFPHMFDYRNYLNSLANFEDGAEEQSRRKKMVLASLHAYRGWFDGNADDFHEAKRLNPEFINYRLWSVRANITNGDWSNSAELREDLEAASFDPLTCQQATQLLWTFKKRFYENGDVPQEIEHFAIRNEKCLLYVRAPEGERGSIYASGWHLPGNAFNNQNTEATSRLGNGNTVITVIIAPRPRRNYRKVLESLRVQTLDRTQYRIIWAEPFGVLSHDQSDIVDEYICCGQMGVFDHLNRCYNLALSRVSSPIILIIDQTAPLPDQFLAVVVKTFINGPEGPLVVSTGNSNNKARILENMRLYQDAAIAFRTNDLISVGGFDEASDFYGLLSGPFDAAHRIAIEPSTFVTIDVGMNEAKNQRCHHALISEHLERLYHLKRILPYQEHEALKELRKLKQD